MFAYRVAYDGRGYHGFQRQPSVPTVEDALLDGLRSLEILEGSHTIPPGYSAASRTDAGVSARAQTVAFEAPDWLSPGTFSSLLPGDIHVWSRAEVNPSFHATHDAIRRSYVYHLQLDDVDERTARATLAALSGYHDFHQFTRDDRGTRRRLVVNVNRDGRWLVIRFGSDGFPRQLVRRVVELVRRVGSGVGSTDLVGRHLREAAVPDHRRVGPAPAHPLVLEDVRYREVDFEVDPEAVNAARRALGGRRDGLETASRVVDGIIPRATTGAHTP